MKSILTFLIVCCSLGLCAAKPVNKTFTWSTELKYPFMPKQKMTFINGVVKNPGRTALPDADAKYSRKVKIRSSTLILLLYFASISGRAVASVFFTTPLINSIFCLGKNGYFNSVDQVKVLWG